MTTPEPQAAQADAPPPTFTVIGFKDDDGNHVFFSLQVLAHNTQHAFGAAALKVREGKDVPVDDESAVFFLALPGYRAFGELCFPDSWPERQGDKMKDFAVVGVHEDSSNLFTIHVSAKNSVSAFKQAEMEALEGNDESEYKSPLLIALPDVADARSLFPLDGAAISVESILDQPDMCETYGVDVDALALLRDEATAPTAPGMLS